jgi:hypothetical protein
MKALLLTLLLPVLAAGDSGINTRVYPQAILRGNSLWLTCRVTPNNSNRLLRYGVVNSEQENTERQLDGKDARITWGPVEIKRVPCDAGPAYCQVLRADGSHSEDIRQINVGGCEP